MVCKHARPKTNRDACVLQLLEQKKAFIQLSLRVFSRGLIQWRDSRVIFYSDRCSFRPAAVSWSLIRNTSDSTTALTSVRSVCVFIFLFSKKVLLPFQCLLFLASLGQLSRCRWARVGVSRWVFFCSQPILFYRVLYRLYPTKHGRR